MMRIRGVLALVAAVLIGVALVPAAATAAPVTAAVDELLEPSWPGASEDLGTYYLRNAGAPNKCLDSPNNSGGANNTPVDLWDCNNGPMLRWTVFYTGGKDYPYTLTNYHFWGKCLDYPASSGGANGRRYNVYDCAYGARQSPGQSFRISEYNAQVGGRLLSVQLGGPNNHMDAFANGGTQNGRPVGNWPWTGHALQHWYFDRV